MPKKKNLKEFKKLSGLVFGAPVVLQGPEILKARSDTARLSGLASGTLQLGVTGRVGQVAFDLAADPFAPKRRKKKRK